jgi:hypothetical protein
VNNYAPDFRAVTRIPFGQKTGPNARLPEPAKTADQPKGRQAFLGTVNKRRFASLQAANQAIDQLPGPGESLHAIMTGFYDLMQLLIVLLERMQSPCTVMRIATLSLSSRNVQEMAALLDAKKIGQLDMLVAGFFKRQNKAIFAELAEEFASRGQRVGVSVNHCKVVTIALEDGRRYTLEGSANLRTNSSTEQFALTQCPLLHGFFDGWIDGMVTANESHERDDCQKG